MKIKTRRYYIYYLAKTGGFIIGIMPLKIGLWLGHYAGRIAFFALWPVRKVMVENLRASFPEKPRAEIERIAKDVLSNLCKNGVELLNGYKLNAGNLGSWVRCEGENHVKDVLSKGKGAIMLASHFGNWELISFYFLLRGYPGTVIARRLYFNRYDKFINRLRVSKGLGVLYRDESPKKILAVLRRNSLLGILADQDVDSVEGVFVDFFGRPAYTPKAPVSIAMASGAALLPCFMIREKGGHRLVVEKPIEVKKTPDKEKTIAAKTGEWSAVLEKYIRKYPEQWVCMHRRWKTKPA